MQASVPLRSQATALPDFEGLESLSLPAGQESNDLIVGIDRAAAVAVIQMNRPAKRNALSHEMMIQLPALLGELDRNDAVRAVVLMGTRKGAFSAGADIKQLNNLTTNSAHERKFLTNLNDGFESFSKPLIAAVEGFALGGGFEVALACDMIYATEDAKFGLPEVSIGCIPGAGGTQRLARALGKHKAMELILQSQTISGKELAEHGIVNKACRGDEDVMVEAMKVATRIATFSRPVVRIAKEAVLTAENNHLNAGMILEKRLYYMTFALDDFKIGTQAFLDKKQPNFKHE
ncbi:enoyl-CoA hydratase/isomerase [Astrocystis sublimbata]|nr:enoyl-CoA hydratase/isomerase [Astrocystis sublimbata]